MQRMISHIKDLLGENKDTIVINPHYSKGDGGLSLALYQMDQEQDKTYAWVFTPQSGPTKRKAKDTVKEILDKHTLRVSIKLSDDFAKVSESPVNVMLLIFELRRPHKADDVVKFIDAGEDGYRRTARRRAKERITDTGEGHARWAEIQSIVEGRTDLERVFYTEEAETYAEDTIITEGEGLGSDWLSVSHIAFDIHVTAEDFQKTIEDYLMWKYDGNMMRALADIIKEEKERKETPQGIA